MGAQVQGSFHWNELRVRDIEKAKTFYADVAGWSYDEIPMEDGQITYYLCKSGEQLVAGMVEMTQETGFPADVPSHWLGYIQVSDVDQALETAKGQGSQVFFGPVEVPGFGCFAVLNDVAGAAVGLITPEQQEAE